MQLFGTKGQKHKLKILLRDGAGRDISFLEKSRTGHETGWDKQYFFPVISCFTTSFPVFLYVRSVKIKLNKVMSPMNESMSEKRNFVLFWQFYFGSGTDPSSFVQ